MLRICQEAYTFDDVLLVPAHSTVLPNTADLHTRLTKNITLNIPMVSAAMDTVTGSQMAIAIAQEGGLGFIHKNMSIEEQAEAVRRVKRFESGMVVAPTTVTPDMTLADVLALTMKNGYAGYPVVDHDGFLVGIITGRDTRFITDMKKPVAEIMTPKDKLVTAKENASREEVKELMQKHKIERVLIVDDSFRLSGMITVKDFQKAERKPNACKDALGRLRVGAAIGAGPGNEARAEALVKAGVDVLLIDSSHGHSQGVLDRIRATREKYPDLEIVGGNVATAEGALALVDAGVNCVKVGIGPGSICTTRIVTGCGVPQLTAVDNAVTALKGTDITVIADGGIRFSGDITKALAAGATSSWSAPCSQAPMRLLARSSSTRDAHSSPTAEWDPLAPCRRRTAHQTATSSPTTPRTSLFLRESREEFRTREPSRTSSSSRWAASRSAMGLLGCATIDDLRTKAQFVKITGAGIKESHVHDVTITKEAPNYRLG